MQSKQDAQFVGNFGDNMSPDRGAPDLTKHHLISCTRSAFRHDALEPSLISINKPEYRRTLRSRWAIGSADAQYRPPHVGQHVGDLGEQLPRLVEHASASVRRQGRRAADPPPVPLLACVSRLADFLVTSRSRGAAVVNPLIEMWMIWAWLCTGPGPAVGFAGSGDRMPRAVPTGRAGAAADGPADHRPLPAGEAPSSTRQPPWCG